MFLYISLYSVEFRWSPEGPVNQIHSPHLHDGTPGIFSDLSRSVQMLKEKWGAESKGKLPNLFIPGKTAAWFLRFRWKTCLRKNCSLGSCVSCERPAFVRTAALVPVLTVGDLPFGKTLWLYIYIYIYISSCSAQGQVFHCKLGTKAAVLLETQEPRLQFY